MSTASDKGFVGSVPQVYEKYLVPLIFQPYADDLARRIAARRPASVLEIAAGTGVVTRAMAKELPAGVTIVATDLNPPMIEQARATGIGRPVDWRQADAMSLPFADASFDAVVCQFGAMFFPDRGAAFAQALRVLRPGGAFLFNVWDRIEDNEFADTVTRSLGETFPADSPLFLRRVPYSYHDPELIRADLACGGFTRRPEVERVTHTSRASSAKDVAIGFCQGTPLRGDIEARDSTALERATDNTARAIARRFGGGAVSGRIQALVIAAERG